MTKGDEDEVEGYRDMGVVPDRVSRGPSLDFETHPDAKEAGNLCIFIWT